MVDTNSDGQVLAYCVGGLLLDCPAKTFPSLVDWALTEAKLGAPRLNRNGKDAEPLLVITDAAAERLGLPAVLEDRRGLRLPEAWAARACSPWRSCPTARSICPTAPAVADLDPGCGPRCWRWSSRTCVGTRCRHCGGR